MLGGQIRHPRDRLTIRLTCDRKAAIDYRCEISVHSESRAIVKSLRRRRVGVADWAVRQWVDSVSAGELAAPAGPLAVPDTRASRSCSQSGVEMLLGCARLSVALCR